MPKTRITDADINGVVKEINRLLGTPEEPYAPDEQGRKCPNEGSYFVEAFEGQDRLSRMLSGGVSESVCEPVVRSKAGLYTTVYTLLQGITLAPNGVNAGGGSLVDPVRGETPCSDEQVDPEDDPDEPDEQADPRDMDE